MTKIAINGFGRIGRAVFKNILDKSLNLEIAAINDLAAPEVLVYLLKYDSVYGIYNKEIELKNNQMVINGRKIELFSEKEPENIPYRNLEIDIVLECTGHFTEKEKAEKHLKAGAKKVIISAPSKSPEIPTFILGINEQKYNSNKDHIVSMASCTTNCLAPIVKVLDENFKIVKGFMTTIHSYTNSQRILDSAHKKLRRARAASLNIIPTTTGAAKTIFKVLPQLKGKLDGSAIRVPIPTVSLVDLVCQTEEETTIEEVNNVFSKASEREELKGILAIEKQALVSSDYIGNSFSAVVDTTLTNVNKNLIKIGAWYDNEWGYAARLAEFTYFVAKSF